MAADTEVCTVNKEWDVEQGGKTGNRFKESMGVTLLERQKRFFKFCVTMAFAAICRFCIQHEKLWNRK